VGRVWRVAATGIAFLTFGLLAVSVGLPLARLVQLGSRDAASGERRVQGVVQRLSLWFMRMLERLGIMRMEVEGAERLARPGILVVANHPTLLDAVALLGQMPEAVCVTKLAHWRNPVMRSAVDAAGYIPNHGGRAVVDDCVRRLREGKSLLLFPEGTRSPKGERGRFQRGAARVALASECDIVPVVITCEPPTLGKGEPWYRVPSRPFALRLRVEEPIPVGDFRRAGVSEGLAARRLSSALSELYDKRLDRVGA